jgi:SWI/SNF-related matrix-associated actin-dependent regulator 1 of chromatin subfamily A
VLDLLRSVQEPVVVWTWHKDIAYKLRRALESQGRSCSILTGDEKHVDRQSAIDSFQAGATDVFIGTMAAGGVGIDLTRARITIFAELDWTPANISQAEARVFRSGQMQPCVTYWPIVANSVEQRIIEVLLRKADESRDDIFPEGAVEVTKPDTEAELISLLDAAMEE